MDGIHGDAGEYLEERSELGDLLRIARDEYPLCIPTIEARIDYINKAIGFNSTMKEDERHEMAREYMEKYDQEPMSLDEFLLLHQSFLTDRDRNLGYAILAMF